MNKIGIIDTVDTDELERQREFIYSIRKNGEKNKKYICVTWGCQMNEHDSENLSAMLEEMGYETTDEEKDADLVIYNTCAVRENAELKVYGNLSHLKIYKDKNPDMTIIVCGCMMQQKHIADEIKSKYTHVDIVFGTHNIYKFPEMLYRHLQDRDKRIFEIWNTDGTLVEGLPGIQKFDVKSYVNIMYGCNNFCTYCVVPYTRGRERSRDHKNITDEVKRLVSEGKKEIILLGQNVNSYGNTLSEKFSFSNLLEELNEIDGLERIRFMTSHPKDLSDDLIFAMANLSKVCENLHLPIQSGSSAILKKMNRHYTKEDYYNLIDKLKNKIPNITLTTDIMVGFPGETEEDFLETLEVVEKVRYDSAFTFLYSMRDGTPAARMKNQISEDIKADRFKRLLASVNKIAMEKNAEYKDKTVEVLVESLSKRDKNKLTGRTRANKLVNFTSPDKEIIGKIVQVKITEPKSFSLNGEIVL